MMARVKNMVRTMVLVKRSMTKKKETHRTLQDYKVQGFFICHIIVIQGIIRSEM